MSIFNVDRVLERPAYYCDHCGLVLSGVRRLKGYNVSLFECDNLHCQAHKVLLKIPDRVVHVTTVTGDP